MFLRPEGFTYVVKKKKKNQGQKSSPIKEIKL